MVNQVVPFLSGQTPTFSAQQLHRLRLHHEAILPRLATRWATLARAEVQLELKRLEVLDLGRGLAREEQVPRLMLLFKADPLVGIGVFEMPRNLALALADRMLGARSSGLGERELREVELALLYQAITAALEQYFGSWGEGIHPRPTVVTHEVEARFLPSSALASQAFLVEMEASVGDCLETLRLLVPVDLLNPLIEQVLSVIRSADPQPPESEALEWNPAYEDIALRVSARLPDLEITPRQLLHWQVGEVLPLAPDAIEKIQLAIQGIPRFGGKLGSLNKRTAVEITHRSEDPVFVRT